MAQQQTAKDRRNPANISRYSESLSPQFLGGEVDPVTGNLIPASRGTVATGSSSAPQTVGASEDTSEDGPRQPQSRLSTIQAANPDLTASPSIPKLGSNGPTPGPAPTYTAPSIKPLVPPAQSSGLNSLMPLLGAVGQIGTKIPFGGSDKPSGTSGDGTRSSDSGGGVTTRDTSAMPDLSDVGNYDYLPATLTPPAQSQSAPYQGPYVEPASVPQYTPPPDPVANIYEPPPYVYQPPAPSNSYPVYDDSPVYSPAPYTPAPYSPPAYEPPAYSASYDDGGDGGGSVICTELHSQGLLDNATYDADGRFGAMVRLHHPDAYYGYIAWAPSVVRAMRRSPLATKIVAWFALPWAQCMAIRIDGFNAYPPLRGWLIYYGGFEVCRVIGKLRRLKNALRRRSHAAA